MYIRGDLLILSAWTLILLRKINYREKIIIINPNQKILSIHSDDRLLYDRHSINIEENNKQKIYYSYSFFPAIFKVCYVNNIIYGRKYI
jgi:hypothetical protein